MTLVTFVTISIRCSCGEDPEVNMNVVSETSCPSPRITKRWPQREQNDKRLVGLLPKQLYKPKETILEE